MYQKGKVFQETKILQYTYCALWMWGCYSWCEVATIWATVHQILGNWKTETQDRSYFYKIAINITVRHWLIIGKVDNVLIELWLFICTVACYLSGQKCGDAMFHVECGNGYLYPQMVL